MAKKGTASPRHASKKAPRHSTPEAASSRNYSLEDILGEYRSQSAETPPEAIEPEQSEAEPVSRQQKLEEVAELAAEMRRERRGEEKQLPKKEAAPVRSEAEKAAARKRKAAKPKPEAESESKAEPEAEAKSESGETPTPKRKNYRPGGDNPNPFRKLYGWFLGQAAVIAIRRRSKVEKEEAERSAEPEVAALQAAKVYASQLPAFFRRSRSAALITLLCVWIALAWGADIPIPGALGTDVLTASLVSLILLLTVMLMGLDVLSVGILSAAGGKPGWETLLTVGCLGSVIDCVCVFVTKNSAAPLPPCAVCCVGVTLALRSSWYRCRSLKSGFLTLHRNPGAYCVNGEKLPLREGKFVVKSRRSTAGFIRQSEAEDISEKTGALIAPFVLAAEVLFSLLAAGLGGSMKELPHCFALLSSVSCGWSALLTLPMLLSPISERMAKKGAAIGGWAGVEELGACRHLILTDSDLFPEGTTAFNSIHILAGQDTEQVISRSGSIVACSGSELARLFSDLMERSGGRTVPVTDFAMEDGGAHGVIEGVEIHVGNAGYMYLLGVKIDPKLVGDTVLYTAYGRELVGAFGVEYTADPKVAEALKTLQRSGRKPVFAPRDFNIDALLVERLFRCKADDFEFPAAEERQLLREYKTEREPTPAAIVSAGGLDGLVDVFDSSRYLSLCGRIVRVTAIVSTALGLLLGFVFCLRGAWSVVSATRVLLYMLFWLLPGLVMGVKAGG